MNDEDKLLYARLEDKVFEAGREYAVVFFGFLTPAERGAADDFLRGKDAAFLFSGGYEDAERTMVFIKPDNDYVTYEGAEEQAMSAVRFTSFAEGKTLSHRDYLGSLMGAGLKREAVGDILPYTDGKKQFCDVVLAKGVAGDVVRNVDRIGRTGVHTSEIPLSALHVPEKIFKEIADTVASLRMDAVMSSGFNLSRGETKEAIEKGLALKNDRLVMSPDSPVAEGDVLSLRGHGKMILSEIGGESKKQRIRIKIKKYI